MYCSLRTLVLIYIFGGLTFVPLVIAAVVAFIYYTSPFAPPPSTASVPNQDKEQVPPESPSEEIKDDDELEGVDAHKVGWLQVSREYDSSIGLIGPDKIPGSHRGKYIDKMRSLLDRQDTLGPNNPGFLKVKAAMFYAVLKHGTSAPAGSADRRQLIPIRDRRTGRCQTRYCPSTLCHVVGTLP